MEMKNLGRKSGGMEVGPATKEEEIYYPEVTITQAVLPGLKGKDVGDAVNLIVEAEVSGINQYGNGDIDYRLKLKKAGIKDKEKDTE